VRPAYTEVMRRIVAGCLIVAAGFAVLASGATGSGTAVKVTVTPKSGGPRTRFVVRFRAPARTGVVGIEERRYAIQVHGRGTGCAQSRGAEIPPTHKGQRVSVKLSGPWCVATYHGRLTETIGPHCRPGEVCPAFAIEIRTIARFRFVVVRSGDVTPPTFGGLKSAVQCFPGPMTPGEQRPVGLSWGAASDGQTPSGQITYDIYAASAAGGENFSQPSWTTQGATSFSTPNLPPGRFFVVRARDAAGNQDHNAVERQAENPCL
jgi:hypothetical protein